MPRDLRDAVATFDRLGRWERAEVGRALRRLGMSYGEIMELIPVPKGTLAGWCREIRLDDGQIAGIKGRRGPRAGPRDTQWRRRAEVEEIQRAARAEASERRQDPLWVAGTVLYWAEGSKTKRVLEVTNSDPRALRLFILWVERYLEPQPEFVLSLNLHIGNDEVAAKTFWTGALGLNSPQYYKTYFKADGTGHRKNHLPCGVCRVRLRRSANAYIRAMAWIDVVAGSPTHPTNMQ